jgi:phosphatidyl-myo-inositol alpha-mannosyltransferase
MSGLDPGGGSAGLLKPAKIALVGENYYPTLGGVQEHIHNLARYLRARGHEARVLTGMPAVERWRGPRDEPWVVRVGKARRYSVMGSRTTFTFGPGVARQLWRTLRRERFDLVHVHAPCDVGLPMLLYPLYRGPVVATLHSPMNNPSPARWLAAPYYQLVLERCCDAVIAVSEAARTAMGRYARFPSRIVPNGVDSRAMAAGRPLPQYQDGRTNILMLGRLEPRNGPDIMFQALPALIARRPDLRLLVAGEGKHGIAEHQAMVPPEAKDHVVFLGSVFEERPDVYASARLCVVPARAGTFSIIVLEALAAGLPVVATPFVQHWQRERHFAPVEVLPDFTPATLADGILRVLAEDPARRIAEGQAVARAFDWEAVGAQIEAVYADVLAARAGVAPVAPPAAADGGR